ncbi:MAG TPA: PAS domain S-box protein [Spirochaetota bacterium]|nr:PAS domain S-box protein [Spirochaetota bacterium]
MTGKPVKTILLVDDEAIIAMSEARMLEKHGYKVITAYTGEQAIKTAAEITSLDLILMDIDLGSGMDGTQAADIILKNMDIPVLFLSSHTEPEVVDKTEKITSYGYVVKNSGETVLLASIRMAFKLHAAHRELRKREEALSKSENKLALIFENTPNAITIIEMETGTVVDANKGIEWTGWTREEVIGKSPAMLQSWINPDEEEIIRSTIRSGGILSNHRVDFHKKDGSVAHGLINSIFIEMDGKQYLLTITNDITRLIDSESELRRTKEELDGTNEELNAAVEELEATNEELQATNEELEKSKNDLETLLAEHKRALNDLREKEYFLKKSQEIGKIGSYIFETPVSGQADQAQAWRSSPVMDEILGIDASYPKTRKSWINLLVDPQAVMKNLREQVYEKKEKFELEYQIRRPSDGEARWIYGMGEPVFDHEGNLKSMIGTAQDITERKNFEISLKRSEERFSDLVQLLPETVFEADRTGRIIFVNQAGLQLFGYSREDVDRGINVIQIIAPEDHQRAFENIERIMKGERSGLNEYKALKKEGTPFPVLVHSSLIVRDGKPEGLRGFLVDISERRLAEKLLLETETRYRSIITSLPIGMHLYRLEPDGRLVFEGANPAADRILGVDNSVFIGRTIEEAFPALAETEVPRRYREVASTGAPWFTEQVDYDENSIRGAFEVHAFRIGGNRMAAAFTDITERKRAEEESKKNQQLLNTVYDNVGAYIFMKDTHYRYTYANKKVCELFGRELSDIIGKTDAAFFSPDSIPEIMKSDNRVIEHGETVTREETNLSSPGGTNPRTYWTVKLPLRDSDGNIYALCGISTDITEFKQIEEVLDEEKVFSSAVLDSVPGLLYLYDEEGRLLRWNKSHETLTGYSREELAGMNIYDWFRHDEQDLATIKAGVERAFSEGYANAEGRLMIKSGEVIPYYFTAKLLLIKGKRYIVGIGIDITARKKAEDALRESEDRWHFALEGAGDGVWDWNAQTDRVYFSHRWKAMLGYDDHEIGDNLREWDSRVHPDDHDRVYAELGRHLEGKTQVYISEHRIRCKNGEYKWILDRGKVISRTPEGKPLRVIGTHTDISELKRNAEALGKAVSEKEALLRELQHRMKNSLAMISGIINLEHERVRDKNLRGVLGNIKGRIESLSSLYALLFQSDTVREVDLGMYIRSIAGLLMDSYGKGRNIRINQSYDPLQVNTKNAAAWGLIVNELLTNSFKYAFPAGRAGDVAISLKKIGGEIVLAVSDNGTGLPADFNIHNPQGLGLMLVKTLTLQLKGILDFERKELNTFLIRVPDAG